MPTAYTAPVATGEITDLPAFAMRCARSFGALVHMRDESADAEIPQRIDPSPYYAECVQRDSRRLAWLRALSPAEAQRACQQDHSRRLASWKRMCDEDAARRVRYQRMLTQAAMWSPPTADHVKMKAFMLEQLSSSINFDCGITSPMPTIRRWPDWLREQIAEAQRSLARSIENHREELERAGRNTSWLRKLRRSLESHAEPAAA